MVLFSYLDLLILLEGTVNNWQNGTTTYRISGYPLYSITLAARQAAGCQKNASIDNYLYMFWIYLDMIYGDIGPPHEQGMATKVALHCCGGRDGRRMSLNVNQKNAIWGF